MLRSSGYLRVTSPPKDQVTARPLPLSWQQLSGRPERLRVPWRKKLTTVGLMYLSFAVIGIAWNRFFDPRYDWTLILVFVSVMVFFALVLKRQQREMRKRFLRRQI